MNQFLDQLQQVFRDVFDDDDLVISVAMKAAEVRGWDSMGHINLVIAIEKRFCIRFSASEIATMRGTDQNVGTLLHLVTLKIGRAEDVRS